MAIIPKIHTINPFDGEGELIYNSNHENATEVKAMTQSLTLGSANNVDHNLGATKEVYDVQLKTSGDVNLELDNWSVSTVNRVIITPAGVGTLSDVKIYIIYKYV